MALLSRPDPIQAFINDVFRWPGLIDRPEIRSDINRIRVEEYEDNGNLIIRAELPGIDTEKSLIIDLSNGVLHINADRRRQLLETTTLTRDEFRYGSYVRSLPIPSNVNTDGIKATSKNGIVEITVPLRKSDSVERKITIQTR